MLILKGFKKFIFLLKIKFDTIEYLNKLKKNNSYFHTFINKKSLAVGVIFLKPGENDTQEPHDSDEIYYILDGNGFLQINDKSHRIKKEEIYFVAKNVPHHFYGNTKNLSVLYFFWWFLILRKEFFTFLPTTLIFFFCNESYSFRVSFVFFC